MTKINQNVGTVEEPILSGEDVILEVTVTDKDGNLFDITGATITYWLREYPDTDNLITKTTGNGITIVDANNFEVNIDSAETEDLYGSYVHRCMVEKGGEKAYVFTGSFEVDK